MKVVADERFARNDTSVTGHILTLVSASPDAIVIAEHTGRAVAERIEGTRLPRKDLPVARRGKQ
jgi:hypothetical protein